MFLNDEFKRKFLKLYNIYPKGKSVAFQNFIAQNKTKSLLFAKKLSKMDSKQLQEYEKKLNS